jgi:hypothetical protein
MWGVDEAGLHQACGVRRTFSLIYAF